MHVPGGQPLTGAQECPHTRAQARTDGLAHPEGKKGVTKSVYQCGHEIVKVDRIYIFGFENASNTEYKINSVNVK